MQTNSTPSHKSVVLPDLGSFSYSVQPVAVASALGVIATLHQYDFQDRNGHHITLHRTVIGTWYELPGVTQDADRRVLMELKAAVEKQK